MLRACMHSWVWFQAALPKLSTAIKLLVTALGVLTTALVLGIGLMAFEDRTGGTGIPFESAVLAHVHTTRLRVPFGVDARMSSTLLKLTNDFEHGLTQVRILRPISPSISTRSRLRALSAVPSAPAGAPLARSRCGRDRDRADRAICRAARRPSHLDEPQLLHAAPPTPQTSTRGRAVMGARRRGGR